MLLLWCINPWHTAHAQQKDVVDEFAAWKGILLNTRLTQRNSIFTDLHHIGKSFVVIRAGLTQHLPYGVDVTAGYARVWLTVPGAKDDALKRNERRPWMQVAVPGKIGRDISLGTRVRYDLRFRQRVVAAELQPKYDLTQRIRLQETLRLNLPSLQTGQVLPYIVLSDEVLLNFGKYVTHNTFDQNRLSLMLGLQHKDLRLQTGYMHRFVQSATVPNRYTSNHNAVVWLFYTLDLRKQEHE
ncbi:DUF2490 domain-containing protein [uncultured Pontibacter sp.]|uniref:DUF2490 domain-containing protein n=1 Tax=uncultured Pontibacter sp. TaxID=453356 RepID=UPI00260CACC8|nr:DUF2490 domain-containing protein [uncultured Pontibacter sp.]